MRGKGRREARASAVREPWNPLLRPKLKLKQSSGVQIDRKTLFHAAMQPYTPVVAGPRDYLDRSRRWIFRVLGSVKEGRAGKEGRPPRAGPRIAGDLSAGAGGPAFRAAILLRGPVLSPPPPWLFT